MQSSLYCSRQCGRVLGKQSNSNRVDCAADASCAATCALVATPYMLQQPTVPSGAFSIK